jgi:Cu-Zn family superoxide dismutase
MKNLLNYAATVMMIMLCCSCTSRSPHIAKAMINSTATSQQIGEATFYRLSNGKIKMDLEINFPARADSTVAIHFHQHGDCGNMAENAHGHWNPTNEPHGQWQSSMYHSGDIGNVQLDAKGHGVVSVSTDRWSVKGKSKKNIIGLAIIVHGGTDDYRTQPTGNSGPRVGCGVIEEVK